MARKHNTKHHRSKSNYPQRLINRGETSVSVRMIPLEQLRRNAVRRGAVIVDAEIGETPCV